MLDTGRPELALGSSSLTDDDRLLDDALGDQRPRRGERRDVERARRAGAARAAGVVVPVARRAPPLARAEALDHRRVVAADRGVAQVARPVAELVQDHGLEVVLLARSGAPAPAPRARRAAARGRARRRACRAGVRVVRQPAGRAHAPDAHVVLAQQRGGAQRALGDEGGGEADVVVPVAQAGDALDRAARVEAPAAGAVAHEGDQAAARDRGRALAQREDEQRVVAGADARRDRGARELGQPAGRRRASG